MKLTVNEVNMLGRFGKNDYNSDDPSESTWTFTVCETNADKGTLSSLIKKGLVICMGSGNDSTVHLTVVGLHEFCKLYPEHDFSKAWKVKNEEQKLPDHLIRKNQ